MSVSRSFVFALVCQEMGAEQAREKLGATGLPFNSLAAIQRSSDGRTNPMVNAGAIATTSLIPGTTVDAKWQFIHDGLSRFAARKLPLNEECPAIGSLTSAFRGRAASASELFWARSLRRSTVRATVSRGSSPPVFLSQRLGMDLFVSNAEAQSALYEIQPTR
jgi:hypothetical protein